jgi:hypothetical protein
MEQIIKKHIAKLICREVRRNKVAYKECIFFNGSNATHKNILCICFLYEGHQHGAVRNLDFISSLKLVIESYFGGVVWVIPTTTEDWENRLNNIPTLTHIWL